MAQCNLVPWNVYGWGVLGLKHSGQQVGAVHLIRGGWGHLGGGKWSKNLLLSLPTYSVNKWHLLCVAALTLVGI